ncbi:MAG: hypothetical protein ACK4YU_00210 [Paracoccus sp. (in: a-proteobacteria)]
MRSLWMLILAVSAALIARRADRHADRRGRSPQLVTDRLQGRPADWTMIDERSDQSFPASDPPGTY